MTNATATGGRRRVRSWVALGRRLGCGRLATSAMTLYRRVLRIETRNMRGRPDFAGCLRARLAIYLPG